MIEGDYFKKIVTTVILVALVVLSFLLLKPILLSIIVGIILAFLFFPLYEFIKKKTKSQNISASLISILLVLVVLVPLWYLVPIVVNQSIKFYISSQQIDFVTPLKNFFPSLFSTETFSNEIGSSIQSFVTRSTNSMMNSFSELIRNFPTIFLQMLVALFTFFFALKDGKKLISYVQSLSPFSKDVEKRLFKSSKDITLSVLYGQVVIGVLQGLVAGIAFFLFGVNNALLLTILAALAGIFPIIGTTIVWIPVAIYLLVAGDGFAAFGVILFGILSSIIENVLKPVFISKRTQLNSSIILIGMVGGLFMFGILGIILGPLILSYLIIVLEIYRNKRIPGVFIKPEIK
jgi:predicted PurR-regulated permease PerM